MLKLIFVGMFALVLTGSANAQVHCPDGTKFAYCPPGQCGFSGRPYACDKRYCSAKHCPHSSRGQFTPLGRAA